MQKKAHLNSSKGKYYITITAAICMSILLAAGIAVTIRYIIEENSLSKTSADYLAVQERNDLFFSKYIYAGVKIENFDVGGMTREQAKAFLSQNMSSDNVRLPDVSLVLGEKSFKVSGNKFVTAIDLDAAISNAWNVGRVGSDEQRLEEINKTATNGRNIAATVVSNPEFLRDEIAVIQKQVEIEKRDATVSFSYKNGPVYTYTNEVTGLKIDPEKIYNDLCAKLAAGEMEIKYEITPTYIYPELKRSDLELNYVRVSKYATYLSSAETGRRKNIEIALETFNLRVLMPGETLSFNQWVGERTSEKGFADGVYINSQQLYDETIGGGVCQVSTTLYYASLLAGANARGKGAPIEILERYPHSWPSTYIAAGIDASVNWPTADLKLRNNGTAPVFIRTFMGKTSVNVEIYGLALPNNAVITTEQELVEVIKAPTEPEYINDTANKYKLAPGQKKTVSEARDGKIINTYQIWTEPGKEPVKTLINTTTYSAFSKKIYVGV